MKWNILLFAIWIASADAGSTDPPSLIPCSAESVPKQAVPVQPDWLEMGPGILSMLKEDFRGVSTVRISIDSNPESGSAADHLVLYFQHHPVWLMSPSGEFNPGAVLLYDLSGISEYLRLLPIDVWDSLVFALENPDDLTLSAITVKHNNQTILDWNGTATLTGSGISRLDMGISILSSKLSQCPETPNGIAFRALQELGKDDGTKYADESPGGWCSEFAAWVLRHHGWDTPAGSIGSRHMRDFFLGYDRLFAIEDVYSGDYTIQMGDYLSMFDGVHSGLFLAYLGPPGPPGPGTRVLTIEGGSRVELCTRCLEDFDHIGNAQ
ncbi:hypothetical protein JXA40_02475 [bacterium]|nr:hypothetical protein [candidate division CSSED10-310 bacterium]